MAIVVVIEFPDSSIEEYEQVFEAGGQAMLDQPKRLHHLCYRTGDTGFVVVNMWEDEAAFGAFGDIIGPALAEVGVEGNPQVFPVHEYIGADGVRRG
jgi:heme-degrading monooxygenase HmoA